MASRYVGSKRGGIYVVSSSSIVTHEPDVTITPVPPELQHLNARDIIVGYRIHNGKLRPRRPNGKPASSLRLAMVGNWKMRCGIATYSESLWPEVAKHVGDFKLFIEKNDQPTGPLTVVGDVALAPDRVVACWRRGEPLNDLIREIKSYDPDVVWIQHEFGLWANAGYWLSLMSQLNDYRVFVTMHSVFHHRDKTIVEAAIPNIIVHLEGAKQVLKEEKGVTGNVYVIPHGCDPVTNVERLWNFYKSEHTFMQFGFGFKYKGWERSIQTTHLLKQKYPDVFFTGLFSESPFNAVDHQIYFDELMQLVHDLKLDDNVAIIRGFQSDAALDAYMRTNQAVLFPYVSHPEHEVFGASGAARLAMSKVVPVVTSDVNHFSDLPTLKGNLPEQYAGLLDMMFSNPLARKTQVDKQLQYLQENTWANVGKRHVQLFMSAEP